MNYLILTCQGTGSTLLQSMLTVYLNLSGIAYYNIDDLITGLEFRDSVLCSNKKLRHKQSVTEIIDLVQQFNMPVVSRLSYYDLLNRKKVYNNENLNLLYNFCNQHFKVIFMSRQPYELALSLCLRDYYINSGIDNKGHFLFNVLERSEFVVDPTIINPTLFEYYLNYYKNYDYWVNDNFPTATQVDYDYLVNNIDESLSCLTGLDFKLYDNWQISFDTMNSVLYNISNDNIGVDKEIVRKIIKLKFAERTLVNNRQLRNTIPIKLNSLNDKKSIIKNITEIDQVYAQWARQSNQF